MTDKEVTNEQLAQEYAASRLGENYTDVLLISRAIRDRAFALTEFTEHGGPDAIGDMYEETVSAKKAKDVEKFVPRILREWQRAGSSEIEDADPAERIKNMLTGMTGGTNALGGMFGAQASDAQKNIATLRRLQGEVENAPNDAARDDAQKRLDKASAQLNAQVGDAMSERMRADGAKELCAKIICAGRGCVPDEIYDSILP